MDMQEFRLSDGVSKLSGVGEQVQEKLKKLDIETVEDLLFLLPNRIEDQSNIKRISELKLLDNSVIAGKISKVHSRRTKKGALMIEAKIVDSSGTIGAVWFNQRFVLSQLKEGSSIILFGTKKLAPTIGNPFVVKKIISKAGFSPIYPLTKGLHQGNIKRLILQALPLHKDVENLVPINLIKKYQLPNRGEALKNVHQPTNPEELAQAKNLFSFEELLTLGISVEINKQKQLERICEKLIVDEDYLKKFTSSLPFPLTNGQRKAAWEIIQGMTRGHPTRRLLYGEVGSGKTVVSLLAAIAVIRSGKNVLVLVPTTTLASQQAKNIQELVGKDIKVSLVTGSIKESLKSEIIVGTHALLNKSDDLEKIGLIIVDEQQRFGVKQRQKLFDNHRDAHLLMTTATPIPRSLAQTLLGNLEMTYLLDKPAHQQKVTTKKFMPNQRSSVINEIKRRLAAKEPGYVICPAIEEVDNETIFIDEDKKSVAKEAKKLKKEFPTAKISALHGQMKAEEKTKVLREFLDGNIDILVSTTVVEVGIDNQNATWMIIENAEMFGLSTLHQLRGRVGRGKKPSVCFVSQTSSDEKSQKRLETLEKSDNGIELAEADLEIRGPGDILGNEQSGLPKLKYADLTNKELVKKIFAESKQIVKDGVDKYPNLKKQIIETDGLATS